MPEPVMTYDLYDPLMLARYVEAPTTRQRALKTLIQTLPAENRAVVEVLLPFLQRVCSYVATNKMTSENIVRAFARKEGCFVC